MGLGGGGGFEWGGSASLQVIGNWINVELSAFQCIWIIWI